MSQPLDFDEEILDIEDLEDIKIIGNNEQLDSTDSIDKEIN